MSRRAFERAVAKQQQKNAATFENDVAEALNPQNATADSLDEPIFVEIVNGVSKARISAVQAERTAQGWKVEVDPKEKKPRFISFSIPAKGKKKTKTKK